MSPASGATEPGYPPQRVGDGSAVSRRVAARALNEAPKVLEV